MGRWDMRVATVLTVTQCLVIASCQAGLGGHAPEPAAGRQPFIAEFKRVDTAGKGSITMDQAVDYYRNRFRELDRNGDRFLDVSELDAAVPIMDATSGKELVLKLDRNSDGKLSEEEFVV